MRDRRVEVVLDLLVGVGEAVGEPEGQIAAGKPAEAFGEQAHDLLLLSRRLHLHLGVALALVLAARPLLGGFPFQPLLFDGGVAEHQDRARHLADLVATMSVGHVDFVVPLRQLAHGRHQPRDRARDRQPDHDGEPAAYRQEADEHHHHAPEGPAHFFEHAVNGGLELADEPVFERLEGVDVLARRIQPLRRGEPLHAALVRRGVGDRTQLVELIDERLERAFDAIDLGLNCLPAEDRGLRILDRPIPDEREQARRREAALREAHQTIRPLLTGPFLASDMRAERARLAHDPSVLGQLPDFVDRRRQQRDDGAEIIQRLWRLHRHPIDVGARAGEHPELVLGGVHVAGELRSRMLVGETHDALLPFRNRLVHERPLVADRIRQRLSLRKDEAYREVAFLLHFMNQIGDRAGFFRDDRDLLGLRIDRLLLDQNFAGKYRECGHRQQTRHCDAHPDADVGQAGHGVMSSILELGSRETILARIGRRLSLSDQPGRAHLLWPETALARSAAAESSWLPTGSARRLGRSIRAIMVPSTVTSPDRKSMREASAMRGTGWICDASKETISRTRSARRPTGREPTCTMITMWIGVASVRPCPNRQRRSMIGTMMPRRLSTPRI